jgi:hypothetical protein
MQEWFNIDGFSQRPQPKATALGREILNNARLVQLNARSHAERRHELVVADRTKPVVAQDSADARYVDAARSRRVERQRFKGRARTQRVQLGSQLGAHEELAHDLPEHERAGVEVEPAPFVEHDSGVHAVWAARGANAKALLVITRQPTPSASRATTQRPLAVPVSRTSTAGEA